MSLDCVLRKQSRLIFFAFRQKIDIPLVVQPLSLVAHKDIKDFHFINPVRIVFFAPHNAAAGRTLRCGFHRFELAGRANILVRTEQVSFLNPTRFFLLIHIVLR